MELPRKDINGKSYLSYSQINTFKKDISQFYDTYILNKPFEGNAYTYFGSKVGVAIEKNSFVGFNASEQETLKKCIRLDLFEKKITIDFGDFYLIGFIDSVSSDFKRIIDYKTGGKGKDAQYSGKDYTQLCYYALGLRQEFGITPDVAQVNFISREGNAFIGERLFIGNEVSLIDIDIGYERLKHVYWETIEIAKKIELFYNENKK